MKVGLVPLKHSGVPSITGWVIVSFSTGRFKKRTTSQQKHVKKVSAQAINTLKELEMALKTLKVEIPGSKSELQKDGDGKSVLVASVSPWIVSVERR